MNIESDTVDAGSFLKSLYLLRSRNLRLIWNPSRIAGFTKPRLWLNPMAVESSPHFYVPHFQDSNTALLSYPCIVLYSSLFPYELREKFCTHIPPFAVQITEHILRKTLHSCLTSSLSGSYILLNISKLHSSNIKQ